MVPFHCVVTIVTAVNCSQGLASLPPFTGGLHSGSGDPVLSVCVSVPKEAWSQPSAAQAWAHSCRKTAKTVQTEGAWFSVCGSRGTEDLSHLSREWWL